MIPALALLMLFQSAPVAPKPVNIGESCPIVQQSGDDYWWYPPIAEHPSCAVLLTLDKTWTAWVWPTERKKFSTRQQGMDWINSHVYAESKQASHPQVHRCCDLVTSKCIPLDADTSICGSPKALTAPKPVTVIEPVTQPVLHCPSGWHVEVWHSAVPFYGATDSIFQSDPDGYIPYSPPIVISFGIPDVDHPDKCVRDPGQTPTVFPAIASAHIVLNFVQAMEQDHLIPVCTEQSTTTCYDRTLPNLKWDEYASKDNCEIYEGVKCASIYGLDDQRWIPIGKPVVYDETPDVNVQTENPPKGPVAPKPVPSLTPYNIIKECEKAGETGCVDVACSGRNIVEGCYNFPNPEYHDFIDDKGVYHANFTDPNNRWRCALTSTLFTGLKTTAFTIVCTEPHDVPITPANGTKP
jgi:hypothetical protein